MKIYLSLFIFILLLSCSKESKKLPIIGTFDIVANDTIYHTIPDFSFTNQDGQIITNETFADKMYITDFFFISCPSICPKVKKQMVRINKKYENNNDVILVSHTIDPKRDNVAALKKYATKLNAKTDKWQFLTGEKDSTIQIADEYYVAAYADAASPGGFDHSGKIILVDKNRHIRAFCDGTDPKSVTRFFDDIDKLVAEYEQ